MGCGASKGGDSEKESVTSKFTPILRWRFEEIKGFKNNNADADGTQSRIGLLYSNHEDDPSLPNSHYADETDKKSEASRQESVKAVGYLKDEDKCEQMKENGAAANNLDDKADINEEEGRLSNVEFSYLYPGSLSFRIYCVDQLVENANDDARHEVDEFSQKSGDIETVPSTSTQESVSPTKGKGKKGGRFMKVMVKGKAGEAVKNLLNDVTSCYHQSKAGHQKPRLLPQT